MIVYRNSCKRILLNPSIDLKESKYNIYMAKHGKEILYNTCSGAIVELDGGFYDFLHRNRRIPIHDLDSMSNWKQGIITLYQHGFLIDADRNELEFIKRQVFNGFNNDYVNIVIVPTTHCNMKCPYCFESGFIDNATINRDLQKQIIKFIKKHFQGKNLTVIWYGGEPLLKMDVIKEISNELKQFTDKNSKTYNAGVVTNGYLLTPSVSDILNELHVRLLQITLDGFEGSHNQRRKLINGSPTFWKIVNNIDYASRFFDVSLRINVDEDNIAECQELLEWISLNRPKWFDQKKNIVPYVAPITKVHKDMSYNYFIARTDFGKIFKDHFMKYFTINSVWEKCIISGKDSYFFNQCCALERKAWSGVFPNAMPNACGVLSNNLITIDAEGNLFKCWDTVGVSDHAIGNVYEGLVNSEWGNKWKSFELSPTCEKCVFLPVCMGGCIRECITNGGQPSCPYDFEILNDIIYYEYKKLVDEIRTDTAVRNG